MIEVNDRMIIRVITIGKTQKGYVKDGIAVFLDRLTHYARVEWIELDDPTARGSDASRKEAEGELLIKQFVPGEFVVLLDERGTELTSEAFAVWFGKRMNSGVRSVALVIGGAYGFSQTIRARADQLLCLSRMTFPHDLVRLILAEQVYRAFTIIRGEKYHHP